LACTDDVNLLEDEVNAMKKNIYVRKNVSRGENRENEAYSDIS
jgi:hypothetical protein